MITAIAWATLNIRRPRYVASFSKSWAVPTGRAGIVTGEIIMGIIGN